MRKKSGFFRRKLGTPHFDSNLDTLPTNVHVADPAAFQDCDKPLGRGPSTHQAERLKDTTPLVPTNPPWYRGTDASSLDVSSHPTSNMHTKSQLARASPCSNRSHPASGSLLTSASSSACSGEPRWDTDTSVPSTLSTTNPIPSRLHTASYQEPHLSNPSAVSFQYHRSAPLEYFLQLTGLKSPGPTPGSSNVVARERPPVSSPSHSRLLSLQATSSTTVSNGERSDLPSSRASQPHSPSPYCLSHALSTTRTTPEPSSSKAQRSSRKSPSITSTATSLTSSLSPTTSTDPPLVSSGPSHTSYGPSGSSLFLEPTPSFCRPPIFNKSELSEEDKLRLSLDTWKLGQDGVLQGGLSPLTSSQTPTACQSSFTFNDYDRSVDQEQAFHTGHSQIQTSHQVDSSSLDSFSSFFSAASDLNDSNLHPPVVQNQVNSNSDRAFLKNSPSLTQHNLGKSPLSDNSAPPSFHGLPSLVNPNRTAMQTRSSGGRSSKSSTYPFFVNSSDCVTHLRIALSSASASSPALASPPPDSNMPTGSRSPDSHLDASQYFSISTAIQLSQLVTSSRTSSLEQSTGADLDPDPGGAIFDLAESQSPVESNLSPVESSLASPHSLQSSQFSSKTIRGSFQVTSLNDTVPADDDNDNRVNDHMASLSPSIRLVSPTTEPAASPSKSLSLVPCAQSPRSLPDTSSPSKLIQSTPSTPTTSTKPTLQLADLITSSTLTGTKTTSTRHVKRGGGGGRLGKQPAQQTSNPSSTPQIPQLQRRHVEKAITAQHSLKPEHSRSPRSHQSSPNLRNPRSPLIPDSPFFSVAVSEPTQPDDNRSSNLAEAESESGPLQIPVTSVNLNPSLLVPGMTVEANALRLAEMFWQEDETIIKQQKLTEWLGSPESNANQLQALTRRAFLDKFDFKDLRIDVAFRKLCSKMYLKGETQQVDRILAEFSRRYWEQNQSTIYVNPDMVHAMSYSILLLNTDLHVVDTVSRMSRSQFIRNTMETIGVQLTHLEFSEGNRPRTPKELSRPSFDASEASWNPLKPSMVHRPRRASIIDLARTPFSPVTSNLAPARPSMERWRDALRSGSQPTPQASRQSRSFTRGSSEDDPHAASRLHSPTWPPPAQTITMDQNSPRDAILSPPPFLIVEDTSAPVVKADKLFKIQFERELEALLKDIYVAIKALPIAQGLAEPRLPNPGQYGSLKRVTSRRSQNSYTVSERNVFNKRASSRGFSSFSGLSTLLPVSAVDTSPPRPNSPAPGSSMSSCSGMTSYSANGGSSFNLANFTTPSTGFVFNLSHSIIREQNEEELLEPNRKTDEQTCDSKLALLGAPWAKEGILQRKRYWESKGKRHKDKGWAEVFVVIQTGTLQMFQFGQSAASRRAGSASAEAARMNSDSSDQKAVGGGNWLPNAHLVGEISLSHALTSVLVSGYSKDRAHVFVLTLSTGASYFFQTGTEELVHEWVSTCNYWAARLSKGPLTGGVSNMEYGWNQLLDMDFIGSSEKKEELQDCQREQEEMMSIGSGQSEHSHKARVHLRDRIFNGLPLGSSILTHQVPQSARPSDVNNRSPSGSSLNSVSLSSSMGSAASSKIHLDRHLGRSSNLPADHSKVFINDWNPPLPPITLSSLNESAQLDNLKRHASHIQKELEQHNSLRKPMINLCWNRPSHLQKAMANWEKKAQYLMAEIIKYTTYLNALEQTIQVKQRLLLAP